MSREPVRLYLGGLLAAIVALLAGYGLLDEQAAALWLAAGTALFAVPAVEATRAKVTPTGPGLPDLEFAEPDEPASE